ncbi:MAG: 30S ribosomal protein S11 [Lentisphaerae bacterium ADurb.BinA184]|nr:MAG: 30S ribosomal protein S11 [Lentisphaerae bacterium ADurb.BinA184]
MVAKANPPATPAAAPETPPAAAPAAPAAPGAEAAAKTARPVRRKSDRHVPSGIAHVDATFNNTKVCITDLNGNVVAWCSAGRLGYKGSKKSTAYVAQLVGTEAAKQAADAGMREVEIRIKGPGAGRESAARGIAAAGIEVTLLRDVTPIPHNGCRPPKRRRV